MWNQVFSAYQNLKTHRITILYWSRNQNDFIKRRFVYTCLILELVWPKSSARQKRELRQPRLFCRLKCKVIKTTQLNVVVPTRRYYIFTQTNTRLETRCWCSSRLRFTFSTIGVFLIQSSNAQTKSVVMLSFHIPFTREFSTLHCILEVQSNVS